MHSSNTSETLILRQQRNECKTNAFEMSDRYNETNNKFTIQINENIENQSGEMTFLDKTQNKEKFRKKIPKICDRMHTTAVRSNKICQTCLTQTRPILLKTLVTTFVILSWHSISEIFNVCHTIYVITLDI